MSETKVTFGSLVPYVSYKDAGAMLDWLHRVFGFEERSRYVDKDGVVRQAEMRVGPAELWLNGMGPGFRDEHPQPPVRWIGVWVDDVDAQHARITAAGVEAAPPEDKNYDVRSFSVEDPEGQTWGFMKRIGIGYVPQLSPEEGGLEEILPTD
jgi:uncharacterized glyoxalase superfamily protein PhnB